ncbi:hypothetical protein BELL_0141g00060 [Botrytis elliptica]|uniref:Heterokaryon incompatibility domain-containing protein n=1 Tax=Botrytis elliptica TaxID=278938 RepID=A0A4Z1JYD7_9HELO|nr:hypothetical protein BELL_0141g00060 [Botrytis elliptica]
MRDSKHKGLVDMTKGTLLLPNPTQSWRISQDEIRNSAFEVLCRPYWSRVWIYQEIIVSDRIWIQCGTIKVSWDDFYYAMIVVLSTSTSYFGAGYDNVIKNRLEGFYWERLEYRKSLGNDGKSSLPLCVPPHIPEDGKRLNLLDLLVTKRGYMASDSRDMIYALSGIAKRPKGTQPFAISYEKSPCQVYSDVVNYLIETDKNYDVLSHAEQYFNHAYHTRPLVPSRMPSWVPDWTTRAQYKQKIVDWVESLDKSRSAVSNSAYLDDQGVLACVGYKIGIINLITDFPRDIQLSDEGRVGRILWNEWKDKKLPDSVLELFSRFHPLIYHRRYAETLEGTCCLVPGGTQTGDIVCQFIGSSLPYILRPIQSTDIKSEEGWRAWKTLLHFSRWWNNSRVPRQELPTKCLDAKISTILENKTSGYQTLEIRHYNFVGECFVDGLMSNENSQTLQRQHSQDKTVFAMH